jgi:hypothetical protein
MGDRFSKGTLVHIPQSVLLMDCDQGFDNVPQLSIPSRVHETKSPTIGVVTDLDDGGDYVRIYCEGNTWSVQSRNVYALGTEGRE